MPVESMSDEELALYTAQSSLGTVAPGTATAAYARARVCAFSYVSNFIPNDLAANHEAGDVKVCPGGEAIRTSMGLGRRRP